VLGRCRDPARHDGAAYQRGIGPGDLDVDLDQNILHVKRQTYPGRGGLVTKTTKGRRRRVVPIIKPLRPTLERLSKGKTPDTRLIAGPRGG
jgi:hypothetical protein